MMFREGITRNPEFTDAESVIAPLIGLPDSMEVEGATYQYGDIILFRGGANGTNGVYTGIVLASERIKGYNEKEEDGNIMYTVWTSIGVFSVVKHEVITAYDAIPYTQYMMDAVRMDKIKYPGRPYHIYQAGYLMAESSLFDGTPHNDRGTCAYQEGDIICAIQAEGLGARNLVPVLGRVLESVDEVKPGVARALKVEVGGRVQRLSPYGAVFKIDGYDLHRSAREA